MPLELLVVSVWVDGVAVEFVLLELVLLLEGVVVELALGVLDGVVVVDDVDGVVVEDDVLELMLPEAEASVVVEEVPEL